MTTYQVFFVVFALSIPIAALVVAGRLVWAAFRSLRAARFMLGALSVLAFVGLAAVFMAVVAVWFGYAVAHSKKDLWREIQVVLITGVPFYLTCFGLWHLGGALARRART